MSQPEATADRIHERAVEWLLERDEAEQQGGWNEADQARLDAWLAESSAHLLAYWRAKSGWERAGVLAALRPVHPPLRPVSSPRRVRWRLPLVAAAVVAVAAVGIAGFEWNAPHYVTYATAVGGRETLALGDGSQIELNTNTVLRIPKKGSRKVILERGEAYFQIKHDEQNPFIVTTSTGRVVDLGTKFVIRQRGQEVQVSLVEGRARFEGEASGREGRSVILDPGDVVVATVDRVSLTKKPTAELKTELGWRKGMLTFRHATLADAAAEFNRYNAEQIIVADPAVAHLEIRGTFRTADVALFARMAQKALGLHVSNRGNEITITQ